ncbi:MAG: ribosomal protein S18-alanine N-acetyltransferase [Lachnospiraceae bacterium]|nr:ribosomal protein S18-alanine N-acetyltransferase [Lachnospiraceae bacterium]
MDDLNLSIREAKPSDVLEIHEIEELSFSEPWSCDAISGAISSIDNIVLVSADENGIYGYLVLYTSLDEGELMTIAVRPGYRGHGIGNMLIESMKKEGKNRDLKYIFLEVRKSNESAKSLYKKNGFIAVGERKNFYRFPTEDAIVGRLEL